MRRDEKERNPIDELPPPHVIRDRLGNTLAEADLLRKLLRLSERAAKLREEMEKELVHA